MLTIFRDLQTPQRAFRRQPKDLFQEMSRNFQQMLEHFDTNTRGDANDWFSPGFFSKGPHFELKDEGSAFVLEAALPGFDRGDLDIQMNAYGMTIKGKRKHEAPEGYATRRQERSNNQFSRSFRFPVQVDLEKVKAELTDGIFTLSVEKAPEAQPRQIEVKVG